MCAVFKTFFISSRLTSLFTKLIVHSVMIPLLIQNLIRFSVKMTPFVKRLYVGETWGIFMRQPVQSVYLSLLLEMAAKWSDLHFSCQTVFQASTFKIPGESAANHLENGSDVGLPPSGKALQKRYSFYFHIFAFISLHRPIFLSYFGCLGKCSCVLNVFWLQYRFNFSCIHFCVFLIEITPSSMQQRNL